MKIVSILCLLMLLALSGCGSAPKRPVAVVEGERLLALGVKAYRNDDLLNASSFFAKALSHHQGLDNAEGQLQSRINLTEVALAVGNLEAAWHHLEQAELLASGVLAGYRPRLKLLRSSCALLAGETLAAQSLSESLLPQNLGGSGSGDGDETIVREALLNRIHLAFQLEGEQPAVWIARAATVAGSDAITLARLARFRAELARRAGDEQGAVLHLQQALELCKGIPSRRCIAGTLEEWGALLQASGNLPGAEEHYQRALAVRMALLDRGGSSKTLRQLADICQATGRGERASALSAWADKVASGSTIDWHRLRGDTLPR